MVKLIIVEDDKEILAALLSLLHYEDGISVIKTFANAEDFINAFMDLDVDIVLMDIGLPGKSGLQAVAEVKQKRPAVQFIMCTVFDDDDKVFNALCAGATGYLLKNTSKEELCQAIYTVQNGGSMMSAAIARKVVESFQKRRAEANVVGALSPRQWEILNYLDKGYRYKEIADKLNLSFETIRTYCRNIYEQLQVHSRTDALNKVFPKN